MAVSDRSPIAFPSKDIGFVLLIRSATLAEVMLVRATRSPTVATGFTADDLGGYNAHYPRNLSTRLNFWKDCIGRIPLFDLTVGGFFLMLRLRRARQLPIGCVQVIGDIRRWCAGEPQSSVALL